MDATLLAVVRESFGSRFFKVVVILILFGSAVAFGVSQYPGLKIIFADASMAVSENEQVIRFTAQVASVGFFVLTVVAALSWVANAIEVRRVRKAQVERFAQLTILFEDMNEICAGQMDITDQIVQSLEEVVEAFPSTTEMHRTLTLLRHRYDVVLQRYADVQRTYARVRSLIKISA